MLKNCDIICFGPSDWWGMNPSCATHIMSRLSQQNRVVYVNPISSDILGMRGKSRLVTRIFRKFKSMIKLVRKSGENLWIVSPLFLPMQGNSLVDKINNLLIGSQIKLLMVFLRFKTPLLWVENIRAADFVKRFKWRFRIYHVSDFFAQCPNTYNKEKLRLREKTVSKNSDLIICVSKKLFESKKDSYDNVHYLPHGVDFDHFDKPAVTRQSFEQLQDIKHPVAGYFGTLTDCNDIELLEYCAVNLPMVTFVFAGQITGGDYTLLSTLPNTVFLGRIAYEDISKLCRIFDVCLLPWKMDKWMESCNPLKLFEYMAAGKPIVSVPIDEIVRNYSDVVSIAEDKAEFCRAIKWELKNDSLARRERRIAVARRNSWGSKIEVLSDLINQGLAKKNREERFIGKRVWAESK